MRFLSRESIVCEKMM